jgi:methyl-accepting chemotaxis protein
VAERLRDIETGSGKVSEIVAEIAKAAREELQGIEQVDRAVAEMDKVTQQNAASAEESSSAAAQLSGQAEELSAMVGSFQLSEDPGAPGEVTRRSPSARLPANASPPQGKRTSTEVAMEGPTALRDLQRPGRFSG